jgi:hypothetical protein
METIKVSKKQISLFLFLLISFLFAVKYGSRITSSYILLASIISAFYLFIWKKRFVFGRFHSKTIYILLAFFTLLFSIVFYKITPESLNVDRWSVITSFWDNYFNNEYVYAAKSHKGNPPGPMPFYYIIALPFYFIGELGFLSIMGSLVFLLILNYLKSPNYLKVTTILLMLSSTFYLWEVTCRSNVFLNASLIVFSIVYFFKTMENKLNKVNLIAIGIIIGLLLSTRNVFVIPYIVFFLYTLKFNLISIKNIIIIGLIAITTFFATFLPFIYNHFEEFKKINPFIIQSTYLMPFSYTVFCVVLSFISFLVVKNKNDVFFYSGIILFITVIIHYIHLIGVSSFNEAFFESRADISYFILSSPFLLIHFILEENVKKLD